MKTLVIGPNSLVGKRFIQMFGDIHEISALGKDDRIEDKASIIYDTIVFLAQSRDHKSAEWTNNLFDTNIGLLFNVIQRLKTRNLIYFSTGSVYSKVPSGDYQNDSPINFADPTPYAASKIVGETILSAHRNVLESIQVLRPFFIYGPGQKENMLMRALSKRITEGQPIRLAQEIGMIFNPVFADDVAVLVDQLVRHPNPGYHAFNVAGGEVVTLRTVVQLIAEQVGREPNIEATLDQPVRMVGINRITGWAAATLVADGLRKSIFRQSEGS